MCQDCPTTEPTLIQRIAARTPLWVPVILVSAIGWAAIIFGMQAIVELLAGA